MDKDSTNMVTVSQGISTSFSRLKFVSLACIAGMVLTAVLCVFYSLSTVSQLGSKVYVIDKGEVMTATRHDASVTRVDEITVQSTRFHELFFNVPPQSDIVRVNIEKAMEISDRSVYDYYNLLRERGFYKKLNDSQGTQWIQVDSVRVRPGVYPYEVLTYGTIWTMRPSNVSKSTFLSQCNMIDVARNAGNLNGLMIENFVVRANDLIETRKR